MKFRYILLALSLLAIAAQAPAARRNALLLPEKVTEARALAASDTAVASGIASIMGRAEALMAKNDLGSVDVLGMAYLLSGDSKYASKAREVLLKGAQAQTWADKEMMMRNPPWQSELQMAHRLFAVANAYDAIYPTLTPAERKKIAGEYYRLAVKPLAEDWILPDSRIHALNSMGHNWWASCVGMCGLGAIAFRDEIPETKKIIDAATQAIVDYFAFEGDDFQNKPRTYDRRGGMYEGQNYAGYGSQEALLYLLALKNATGSRLPEIPQLGNLASYFVHTAYPVAGEPMMTVYFGDSHKHTTAHNALMLLDAIGLGSPETDWYLANVKENQHREFLGLSSPVGLLYTPRHSKVKNPSAPLSEVYPDMGWATMRSSWDPGATLLAVKSGLTWNHAHADAGSFILFHKGRDIIGEGGRCWYKLPEYRDYFFTSRAHNVVLADGRGQPKFQQYHSSPISGSVSHLLDHDGVKYVMADATGPNSDRFNRYKRSFLWLDDVLFIIDDISTHDSASLQWLWHPIGEVKKKGIDLHVANGDARVIMRQLYPETLAPSDFIHDYPTLMTWDVVDAPGEDNKSRQPYWQFNLPKKTDRTKGVMAVMLEPDSAPAIEKRHGDGWLGMRISNADGSVTDVYINTLADGSLMHQNSWIRPDGFWTDAYLTALTYPSAAALRAGKPSRKAMVYGSRLAAPDGKILHSSSAKTDRIW